MSKVKKCCNHLLQPNTTSFFVTIKCQNIQKKWWTSMKIANTDRESFHIFWKTSGISMKFSRKMWLMIILKVIKNQDFTLFLEDTFLFLEKPRGLTSYCSFSSPILSAIVIIIFYILSKISFLKHKGLSVAKVVSVTKTWHDFAVHFF